MAPPLAVLARQVSFRYDTGITALNGINLSVEQGEKVGIIGPNGAGKSTFLTLLNGLRKPTGQLDIFGLSLSVKENIKRVRELVGLVFQNPDDQLFMPEVYEDVAFGPRNKKMSEDDVKRSVSEALDVLDISALRNRSTLQLSFGQKKLTAIAGVLAMQPKLIALDEPTGNLDAFHRRKLIHWLNASRQTALITSHDLDLLWEVCSRIVILNEGRVIANDASSVILKNESLLKENKLELPFRFQK